MQIGNGKPFFFSWHQHWKGLYINLPGYTLRIFLFGLDLRRHRDARDFSFGGR